jgi:hypothetical protein
MDGCWWFSIEHAQKMGESKAGELFAISHKYWSASCPRLKCGRKSFDATATSFFFCSRTPPPLGLTTLATRKIQTSGPSND